MCIKNTMKKMIHKTLPGLMTENQTNKRHENLPTRYEELLNPFRMLMIETRNVKEIHKGAALF